MSAVACALLWFLVPAPVLSEEIDIFDLGSPLQDEEIKAQLQPRQEMGMAVKELKYRPEHDTHAMFLLTAIKEADQMVTLTQELRANMDFRLPEVKAVVEVFETTRLMNSWLFELSGSLLGEVSALSSRWKSFLMVLELGDDAKATEHVGLDELHSKLKMFAKLRQEWKENVMAEQSEWMKFASQAFTGRHPDEVKQVGEALAEKEKAEKEGIARTKALQSAVLALATKKLQLEQARHDYYLSAKKAKREVDIGDRKTQIEKLQTELNNEEKWFGLFRSQETVNILKFQKSDAQRRLDQLRDFDRLESILWPTGAPVEVAARQKNLLEAEVQKMTEETGLLKRDYKDAKSRLEIATKKWENMKEALRRNGVMTVEQLDRAQKSFNAFQQALENPMKIQAFEQFFKRQLEAYDKIVHQLDNTKKEEKLAFARKWLSHEQSEAPVSSLTVMSRHLLPILQEKTSQEQHLQIAAPAPAPKTREDL